MTRLDNILSTIIEGIIEKNSYERRNYESVDEKSLAILGYVPKNEEKRIQAVINNLKS